MFRFSFSNFELLHVAIPNKRHQNHCENVDRNRNVLDDSSRACAFSHRTRVKTFIDEYCDRFRSITHNLLTITVFNRSRVKCSSL